MANTDIIPINKSSLEFSIILKSVGEPEMQFEEF